MHKFLIKGDRKLHDNDSVPLPRILVVCGQNNSGKSTFLNALNSSSAHAILSVDDTVIDEIINIALADARINSNYQNPTQRSKGSELLKERLANALAPLRDMSVCIFSIKEATHRLRENYSPGYNDFSFDIDAFSSIATNVLRTVLEEKKRIMKWPIVHERRHINSYVDLKSIHAMGGNGDGIVEYLFTLKMSDQASDNYKQYCTLVGDYFNVSGGYTFDVIVDVGRLRLVIKKDNSWLHIENWGSGMQDLLVIMTAASANNYIAIEEPENHMHPDMQNRLARHLQHSNLTSIILLTHSSVFLRRGFADVVLMTSYLDGAIKVSEATDRVSLLSDLGYTIEDNLTADLIVLTEGPTDIPFFEEFMRKKEFDRKINIKFWGLGGDIMDQMNIEIFKESSNVIAIIDNDPGSSKVRNRFIRNCEKLSIPVTKLKRYALENYFTLDSLKAVFGASEINVTTIAPDKKLENQIHINVKKNIYKIAQHMSLDDIKGTDLDDFFNEIENIYIEKKQDQTNL